MPLVTGASWWVLEKGAAMPVGEGARWTVVDCSGWLLMVAMVLVLVLTVMAMLLVVCFFERKAPHQIETGKNTIAN